MMGYDIRFKVKVEGKDIYVPVGDCEAGTTWNVRDIIVKSTGLEWKNEASNGLVKDVIPNIVKGIGELVSKPELYKPLEPKNGWGSVKSTIRFFEDIYTAYKELRRQSPELLEVAEFWIE